MSQFYTPDTISLANNRAAALQDAAGQRKGIGTQIGHTWQADGLFTPLALWADRSLQGFKREPGYNLYTDDDNFYQTLKQQLSPRAFRQVADHSRSRAEAEFRAGQQMMLEDRRQGVNPWIGIPASFVDPGNVLLAIASGGASAAMASRVAMSRVQTIGASGLIDVALEQPLNLMALNEDPEFGATAYALSTGMAFAGGALGGALMSNAQYRQAARRTQKRAERQALDTASGGNLGEALSDAGRRHYAELDTPEAKAKYRDEYVDLLPYDDADKQILKEMDPDEAMARLDPKTRHDDVVGTRQDEAPDEAPETPEPQPSPIRDEPNEALAARLSDIKAEAEDLAASTQELQRRIYESEDPDEFVKAVEPMFQTEQGKKALKEAYEEGPPLNEPPPASRRVVEEFTNDSGEPDSRVVIDSRSQKGNLTNYERAARSQGGGSARVPEQGDADWAGVPGGLERGRRYSAAISDAARANPNGAAVELKADSFYENPETTLFHDEANKAGVAVTSDGDIVAAFRHPDGTKGAFEPLFAQASQIARTLDAFATRGVLPTLYGKHGWRPVARVRFNPDYAPPGWRAEDGTPDVVLMVRDIDGESGLPAVPLKKDGGYESIADQVPVFDDWEEAVAHRAKVLQTMEGTAPPKLKTQHRDRALAEAREAFGDEEAAYAFMVTDAFARSWAKANRRSVDDFYRTLKFTKDEPAAADALNQMEEFLSPEGEAVVGPFRAPDGMAHGPGRKWVLKKIQEFIARFASEKPVVPESADLLTPEGQAAGIEAIVEHTLRELAAWNRLVSDGEKYTSFYVTDILERANPRMQEYARARYGRNLTEDEVRFVHLLSAYGSGNATPQADTLAGLTVFDEYMRTGKFTGLADGPKPKYKAFERGKPTQRAYFDSETGKLTPVAKGNRPAFITPRRAQVTKTFNVTALKTVSHIFNKFDGDLKKTMDWIGSEHSWDEIVEMIGGERASKLSQHEYLKKDRPIMGAFALSNNPKHGSYILNRWQRLDTVTKDLWLMRTMRRYFREDITDGDPWPTTTRPSKKNPIPGNIKREMVDEAYRRVGRKLGVSPAEVQEMMWDAEKRIYAMLGAQDDTAYVSDGVERAIETLLTEAQLEKVTPRKKVLYQSSTQKARGSYEVNKAGQRIIRALTDPNQSTLPHEVAHDFLNMLPQIDSDLAERAAKALGARSYAEIKVKHHEKFARGFEAYLRQGRAPNAELRGAFEKYRQWLLDIYRRIRGTPLHGKLNRDLRKVFDDMLTFGDDAVPPVQKLTRKAGDFATDGVSDSRGTRTNLRFGMVGRVLSSGSENVRWLARALVEDVLPNADGSKNNQAAFEWVHMKHGAAMANVRRATIGAYNSYRRAAAKRGDDVMSHEQYMAHLTDAKRSGAKLAPDEQRALDEGDKALREALESYQRHTGIRSDIQHDPTYMPRILDMHAWDQAIAKHGEDRMIELIAGAHRRKVPQLTDKEATVIARGYVATVLELRDSPMQVNLVLQGQRADKLAGLLRTGLKKEGFSGEQVERFIAQTMRKLQRQPGPQSKHMKHRLDMDESFAMTFPTKDGGTETVQLMDLYERNYEELIDRYTRSMYGEAATKAIYKDLTRRMWTQTGGREFAKFDDVKDYLRKEMENRGDLLRSVGKYIDAPKKQLERLEAMDKLVRGVPLQPTTEMDRLRRGVMGYNLLRLSGGFGVASMVEVGFVVGEVGARAMAQQIPIIPKILGNARTGQMDNALLRDIEAITGIGTERLRNRISGRIDHESADYGLRKGDRRWRKLEKGMLDASGLPQVDAFLRRTMAATASQRFVNMAQRFDPAQGRLGMSEARLKSMGLDKADAERILGAIKSEIQRADGGVTLEGGRLIRFEPEKFADQEAVSMYIAALNNWSQRAVLKPDPGQLSLWMHGNIGKLITQFQRFHLSSWEKHLLFASTHIDHVTATNFFIAATMGTLLWTAQEYARALGHEDGDEMREEITLSRAIRAGVQRAGMASFVPQVVDQTAALFIDEPIFNARNVRLTQTGTVPMLGNDQNPTFALYGDIFSAVRNIGHAAVDPDEDITTADIRRIINLAPGRNIQGFQPTVNLLLEQTGLPTEE